MPYVHTLYSHMIICFFVILPRISDVNLHKCTIWWLNVLHLQIFHISAHLHFHRDTEAVKLDQISLVFRQRSEKQTAYLSTIWTAASCIVVTSLDLIMMSAWNIFHSSTMNACFLAVLHLLPNRLVTFAVESRSNEKTLIWFPKLFHSICTGFCIQQNVKFEGAGENLHVSALASPD